MSDRQELCLHLAVTGPMTQCVLFHNNTADAKLMGIEYLISKDMYAMLPAEEQQLWHSHIFEVSGAAHALTAVHSMQYGATKCFGQPTLCKAYA